mmetsp:Transcript_111462/g.347435  ORF Transcript_111462/g.347435 Transcript_111462/m.347435 type:complete len:221 (-) Transcript_111462:81-743(-)
MTVLCTPSHETWSTTYSLPRRYSWTRTAAPKLPTVRCAPMSKLKCASVSSRLWHSFTPSEPADSTGFTTTGMASPSAKDLTCVHSVPEASRTARRPAALTHCCCTLLLRLFVCAPFVRKPSSSERASANVMPVSQPTMHATSSVSRQADRTARAVSRMVDLSSTSAWYCMSLAMAGTWFVRISTVNSLDQTAITANPRPAISTARVPPVERGSTTMTHAP